MEKNKSLDDIIKEDLQRQEKEELQRQEAEAAKLAAEQKLIEKQVRETSKIIRKETPIIDAFDKYTKNGNKELIENFTTDNIKFALYRKDLHAKKDCPVDNRIFVAMKDRIEELKELEKLKRTAKEKWKDRIVGASLTLFVGLILWLLKYFFS